MSRLDVVGGKKPFESTAVGVYLNTLRGIPSTVKKEFLELRERNSKKMSTFQAARELQNQDITEERRSELIKLISQPAIGAISEARPVVNTVKTASQKLIESIKQSKPVRKELEQIYTAERARKFGEAQEALQKAGGGKAGYIESLGKLKGELAQTKPKFEVPKLEQVDVDELFNQIQQFPRFNFIDQLNASNGLNKLLGGEIPQPKQIAYLEEVFGSDIVRAISSKRSTGEKIKDIITEVVNIPRSLITSIDMSAPLRQGVLLTVTKPKQSIPAFGEMFKQAFSEKRFTEWLDNLKNSKDWRVMNDSGLYISDPTKLAGGLSAKEESFMSNLAEKIPVWGKLVRASNRAYTGYLNKLRVDTFKSIASKFEKDGVATPENLSSLASFVNNATGRGDLGKLNRVAQQLNNVFFSPRLIAARYNMLNPLWYAKQSAPVRKEAIKTFAEFIGIGSTVLVLSSAAGADVETNPTSTDFGKIKIEDTRYDIWGGFQQWVRVFSQIASGKRMSAQGKKISLSGEKFPFDTRLDVATRFLRGKLAPIPSLLLDILDGAKDSQGNPLNLSDEVKNNIIPLYLQDMDDAIKEFGPEALFSVGLPAFFGVGTQTYKQKDFKRTKGSRLDN